ncbi:MAG: MBG domain-containing protein, partial [Bacteroidota bacterium]|nr:MBG domain-containing protein [Bacteroidota bacterium]
MVARIGGLLLLVFFIFLGTSGNVEGSWLSGNRTSFNRLSAREYRSLFTIPATNKLTMKFDSATRTASYGDTIFLHVSTTHWDNVTNIYYSTPDTDIVTIRDTILTFKKFGTATIYAGQTKTAWKEASNAMQVVTVKKRKLILTAVNKTKIYGSDNPALEISYSGFVTGETPAVIDHLPTITTTADKTSPVGNYPITLGSDGFDDCYDLQTVNGTLAITRAPLTVNVDNKSKVYGDANPAFTCSTLSGIQNGDPITVNYICLDVHNNPVDYKTDAGNYPIVPIISSDPAN